MTDLTAHPVTPHELDMWLRSTEMDDIDDGVEPQPQRLLPNLGAPPPLSAATTTRPDHTKNAKNKKNKPLHRFCRRSSLDIGDGSAVHGNYFGIDARTALFASTNASGRFRRHNNEEQDGGVAAAAADHQGNGNNRARRIVSEGDASPVGTRDPSRPVQRCSSGCSSHSNSSHRTPLQGNQAGGCGSSVRTSSSSDTAPVSNTFHRSVSDVSMQPPYQEEHGLSPCQFTRSASLPADNNSLQFGSPPLQVCHSLPLPEGHAHRRHSHSTSSQLAVAASNGPGPAHTLQDLSHFLNAMEHSQKSQDCIHSGRRLHPRRSFAMMRETNRSRELLLSALNGSANNIEGSKSFPTYLRDNKHMRVGSWRQQDMRNTMLRTMMEEEENAIMGGKQDNAAARYLSGCWKPVSKHYHSNNYPSSSNNQYDFHHPRKPHQGEFDQESAVQAELQRIAREQMMEMEQQQQFIIH